MSAVAAFDCGTNSLRLLVAEVTADGRLHERAREMRIVRLGEGVYRTGRIGPAALQRVLGALDEYAGIVARHGVDRMRFCATSAARDAENAHEFVEAVEGRLGLTPEVLTGEEEARLSFDGAVRSVARAVPAPYLVVDIGGGSTELICGAERVEEAVSLDIGSVRLTERHLRSDPATAAEIEAVRADIASAFDGCGVDIAAASSVIGVAGTVTTVAAGALRLDSYDREVIHHSVLSTVSVEATVRDLLAMTTEQRRALPWMHPGRADVIGAGGLILTGLLERSPVSSLLVSEQDILDGIAWSLV